MYSLKQQFLILTRNGSAAFLSEIEIKTTILYLILFPQEHPTYTCDVQHWSLPQSNRCTELTANE